MPRTGASANVDWRLVPALGVPGAIGAFAGATVLSSLAAEAAAPLMAASCWRSASICSAASPRANHAGAPAGDRADLVARAGGPWRAPGELGPV